MKFAARIFSSSLISFMISLFISAPVLAIPSLPASFYGTVKVNSANVPDGTVVQALIDGQVYAEAYTQTYQGSSVYTLDVRGDDTETASQDGGRQADTVQFKIGGVFASQTAVWHSGTNVNLDLTASSSGSISAPQATPTAVATLTAIVVAVQSSPVPTSTVQVSPTPESLILPSQIATRSSQSPLVPALRPGSPNPSVPFNDTNNGLSSIARMIIIFFLLVVAIGTATAVWILRKKNM